MSRIDETIQAKIEKRHQLEAQGVAAHPYSFAKTHTVAAAREAAGQIVTTAGRIKAWRAHGKVVFADIVDQSGQIQLLLHAATLGETRFKLLASIDPGDFLGVTGEVATTRTGEITIQVKEFEFLGKALRPLPTEWNQAEDKEVRFRQRYLDMLVNPEVRRILDARWLIEKELRRYLQDEHNFVEVETPILQALYGGTNAKPFTTHMNALDSDYYLRLAPELYLKRLIVGGYDKVFEIARNLQRRD
jgi:lysyl-tRNA synthetase class 2